MLYQFLNAERGRSFEDHLYQTVKHAILPMLEYLEDICHRPIQRPDLEIHNLFKNPYKHITFKVYEIDLSTQSPLPQMLSPLHSFMCKLWKAKVVINVPRHAEHEFWLKEGADTILEPEDGDRNRVSTTEVVIEAFGTTKHEAKSLAMMKLNGFISACRQEIHPRVRGRSAYSSPSSEPDFSGPSLRPDVAGRMAKQVFKFYMDFKPELLRNPIYQLIWDELWQILENYAAMDHGIQPLILYYKVMFFLSCPLCLIAYQDCH
jgi:hypothetical protein